MRLIKFKIWDKKNKKWHIQYPNCGSFFSIWKDGTISRDSEDDDYIFVEFTGLKDKNSKEIYEGDIIGLPPDNVHGVVGFGEHNVIEDYYMYSAYGWYLKDAKTESGILTEDLKQVEIIGNAFEHPELQRGE